MGERSPCGPSSNLGTSTRGLLGVVGDFGSTECAINVAVLAGEVSVAPLAAGEVGNCFLLACQILALLLFAVARGPLLLLLVPLRRPVV